MSQDVIESYLVALEFKVDKGTLDQFTGAMKGAATTVSSSVGGIVGDLLKFQIAGTTAFATVGFGIIGYIEKLAMGDQKMRLFAEKSFMTIQQARSVQTALGVLGATIDDVAWDKELHKRFVTLIQDQKDLSKMLGPQYEAQMESVRDVWFQLQRLEVKGEYFGMKFASDLLEKLGFGSGGILLQLQKLNDYVMEKMPEWSDELSTDVIPVLKDFWGILKDSWMVLEDLAHLFTYFIGIVSGDDSLKSQTTSFHQFAQAIGWVVQELDTTLKLMLAIEKAGADVAGGHFKQAWADLADSSINGSKDTIPGLPGSASPGVGLTHGATIDFDAVVNAVGWVESRNRQTDAHGNVIRSNKGAIGQMQLEPGTAAALGVNPYNQADNVRGGRILLQQLLNKYGNLETALAAYNGGERLVDRALKSGKGIPQWGQDYYKAVEDHAGITVGSIVVHIPAGAAVTPHQVAAAVAKGVADGMDQHVRQGMTQSGGAYQ